MAETVKPGYAMIAFARSFRDNAREQGQPNAFVCYMGDGVLVFAAVGDALDGFREMLEAEGIRIDLIPEGRLDR